MQKKQKIKATGKRQALPGSLWKMKRSLVNGVDYFNYLHTKHTFSLLPALKNALLVCPFSECHFLLDVSF